MRLCCENKATTSISCNSIQHDRMTQVEIDRHFMKEKLDNDLLLYHLCQRKNN